MARPLAVLWVVLLVGALGCSRSSTDSPSRSASDYFERGKRYADQRHHAEAVASYDRAIELRPDYAPFYLHRGITHEELGNYGPARVDYGQCTQLAPRWPDGHNSLAWLLATCSDPTFRDGPRALQHATRACELSGWDDADRLETLAAAHAEAGDFKEAVRWQRRALELADGTPAEELGESRERLKRYEAGEPYRQLGRP